MKSSLTIPAWFLLRFFFLLLFLNCWYSSGSCPWASTLPILHTLAQITSTTSELLRTSRYRTKLECLSGTPNSTCPKTIYHLPKTMFLPHSLWQLSFQHARVSSHKPCLFIVKSLSFYILNIFLIHSFFLTINNIVIYHYSSQLM